MHRIRVEELPEPESLTVRRSLVIEGDEAHHALRVKRLRPGERIELLDGRGGTAGAVVIGAEAARGTTKAHRRAGASARPSDASLIVEPDSVRRVERERPALFVMAPVPKGDRADQLVEGLSEVGVAAWIPLMTDRSVSTARPSLRERWERLAWESAKQCGRAWVLEIGESRRLSDVLSSQSAPNVLRILADASGELAPTLSKLQETIERIELLIGPEGGWSPSELESARAAGLRICRFGRHIMRLETAAVAAAAILAERFTPGSHSTS